MALSYDVEQQQEAVSCVAAAFDRAGRMRARAAVIVAEALSDEDGCAEALAQWIGNRSRWSRDRASALELSAGRHVLVLAPIGFASHAYDLCEQIVRAIDARGFVRKSDAMPRIALGVAVFPDDGIDPCSLLARAEANLANGSATAGATPPAVR